MVGLGWLCGSEGSSIGDSVGCVWVVLLLVLWGHPLLEQGSHL